MPRTPRAPQAATEADSAPALPAIHVDIQQLDILDLPLLARMETAGELGASEQNALLMEAIPILDRLVVGGLKGYKIGQLAAVMAAVTGAIAEASNPGN
jgi:hypothetical protein